MPELDQAAPSLAVQCVEAIATKRQQRLEAEAQKPPFKPRRHYASMLNGCARQLVYAHVAWDLKARFSPDGIAAMEDGKHEERLLIQELIQDGFEVVEQQVQLDDDRYFVTGKIDGKIRWQGRKIPFECKRVKPFVFDRLETLDDLKRDAFSLRHLRQLTLYLFLHSEPDGLLILSDGLGRRRFIVVPLDYELAESILKDLDTANAAMAKIHSAEDWASQLPPRIPYDSKICGYCPWKDTCLPQVNFGDGAHIAEPELIEKLRRLQDLKPLAAELERLKREIKPIVEGQEITVAGGYVVTGKWQERTVAAQPAHTDRFWAWQVEPLTNGASQG